MTLFIKSVWKILLVNDIINSNKLLHLLQKGTPFCKAGRLQPPGFFAKIRPVAEGGKRHPALLGRRCARDFPGLPPLINAMEVFGQRSGRPPEPDALCLCGGDALGLPLPDIGALALGHKGQHLQHDVAEECAHQVLAPAGVQQRHIQHHDVNALFLRQHPPLFQNFRIVAPQPVDALDVEQIAFFQFPQQAFVLRAVKVLAGLPVRVDVFLRNRPLPQGDQLPVLPLVFAADADVSVIHSRDVSHLPALF